MTAVLVVVCFNADTCFFAKDFYLQCQSQIHYM